MGESEEEKRDGTVSTIIIEIISSIAFYTIQRKRALMMIVVIRPTEREREREEKNSTREETRERERERTSFDDRCAIIVLPQNQTRL